MHLLPAREARTGFAETTPVVRVAAGIVGAVRHPTQLGQVAQVWEAEGPGEREAQPTVIRRRGRYAQGTAGPRVQRPRQPSQHVVRHRRYS